jgi:hypothetical protein
MPRGALASPSTYGGPAFRAEGCRRQPSVSRSRVSEIEASVDALQPTRRTGRERQSRLESLCRQAWVAKLEQRGRARDRCGGGRGVPVKGGVSRSLTAEAPSAPHASPRDPHPVPQDPPSGSRSSRTTPFIVSVRRHHRNDSLRAVRSRETAGGGFEANRAFADEADCQVRIR